MNDRDKMEVKITEILKLSNTLKTIKTINLSVDAASDIETVYTELDAMVDTHLKQK